MARHRAAGPAWFWYSPRPSVNIWIDTGVYPLLRFGRSLMSCPTWTCVADGYPHLDRRAARIDVEMVKRPSPGIEFCQTRPFHANLVARSWLAEVEDLLDDSRIFLGEVRVAGQVLDDWVTINERWGPALFASDGRGEWCRHCGHLGMGLWGRIYFAEPEIAGRAIMVNDNGLFVRDDIVRDRKLRRPAGAERPGRVRLQPTPKPGGAASPGAPG